jgi:hypothetical protein
MSLIIKKKVFYLLEYYITGGILRMTKAAFAKEILRKDSILRKLFANEKGFQNTPGFYKDEKGNVDIDFNSYKGIKLTEDPEVLVKELKQRYEKEIGGKLYYKGVYETFRQEFNFDIELD